LVSVASDAAQPLVAGSLLPTDLGLSQADRKLVFRMDEMQSEILQPEVPAGGYVSLPGPAWETRTEGESEIKEQTDFLPFSAAISFFFFWCLAGAGQPSNMVRCIAFRDSKTLSKAIFTVSVYYSLIYFPIVIIFCCARTLLPGMEAESDRIMPEMASTVTSLFGVPWLAGLLVAAPFAAVMSTMDSSLLLVSSSVIRDIYVRWIQPDPTEKTTKILTYGTTFVVGILAMIAAINPPQFLQDIIVFTGSGLATAFLVPVTLALYWPRLNSAGPAEFKQDEGCLTRLGPDRHHRASTGSRTPPHMDRSRNETLVYGFLETTDKPASAYEILDGLRGDGLRAPQQVYRALSKLIETGAVHRIESLNAFTR